MKNECGQRQGGEAISRRKKIESSVLKLITPRERLRLRDDVLNHMQTREWIFNRVEKDDTILLVRERGVFGWDTKKGDTD